MGDCLALLMNRAHPRPPPQLVSCEFRAYLKLLPRRGIAAPRSSTARAASTRRRLIECAEFVKNRARLVEQVACRCQITGGLAQCRTRHHGAREVIARADAFQDLHCGFDIRFGGSWGLWREAFCHQPARCTSEMGVAQSPARLQQSTDQGTGGGTIAPAKEALGEE